MFIVQLHYLVDISEVDKYLDAHREFLDIYYNTGLFLVSGPMIPRVGGIIVATGNDKQALQAILAQDPFAQAEIARYDIIEFTPVKYRPELNELIRG